MSKYYPITTVTVKENTYGGFVTVKTLTNFASCHNLDIDTVGVDLDNWGSSSIEPILSGTRAATDEEKAEHKAKWDKAEAIRKAKQIEADSKKLAKLEKEIAKLKKSIDKESK